MRLYNSKTNKVEKFESIEEGKVSMYVCGPTVYNHAHIGNARPIVVFDLLRRVLTAQGYDVHYVSNYTDIDDKIIDKALENKSKESDIAQQYIEAYEKIRDDLNANYLDAKPRVSDNIAGIINFIESLVANNKAYEVNGNVYFRVSEIEDYGVISSQDINALLVGSRIEKNLEKENPLDFVLWKKTDSGISWESPWSFGRPGWHTECVVMIHKEFRSNKIDIHGGGQDLKFPHHENESAQNKALHHQDLANYWVHNAMLNIEGDKMSKSLGNVTWAKDFIADLGPNVSRWLLLSTHYRLILNVSDDLIQQSIQNVKRIEDALNRASIYLQLNPQIQDFSMIPHELYGQFMEALYDDLNIANAQKHLFENIKLLNSSLRANDFKSIRSLYYSLLAMVEILGLNFDLKVLDESDKNLFQKWETFKKNRDFEKADEVREQLIEKELL